jgi:hypothetical protein
MSHGRTFARRVARMGAVGAVAALLGAGGALLTASSSGAATLTCPNFDDTDVPTPPAGQTGYLFIGTSVSTVTSTITVTYSVSGGPAQTTNVDGTQQGHGAFHYFVNLPQGAVVSDATVTGATGNTVVTVSGCLNGPPLTTGSPGSPDTVVSPETVVRPPSPAAAVANVTPRLTG